MIHAITASFTILDVYGHIYRIWGSHRGGYEEYYLLGYNAMLSVESEPTFPRNLSPPSSSV
jgi:hypothetical protein